MVRKIIKIHEEACNGCGICAEACHEGVIQMVNGKAKLTREDYCDGLGDCLPGCPTGAITFEVREAPAYDEAAVLRAKQAAQASVHPHSHAMHTCPGSMSRSICHQPMEGSQLPEPVAGAAQAGAGPCAVLSGGAPAGSGRLHSLRLRQFPSGIYERSHHDHRMSQAG